MLPFRFSSSVTVSMSVVNFSALGVGLVLLQIAFRRNGSSALKFAHFGGNVP